MADRSDEIDVLQEVREERWAQDEKWGQQNHPDGTTPGYLWPNVFRWPIGVCRELVRDQVDLDASRGDCTYLGILLEEVLEAAAETDQAALRAELLQVAAVAVAWVQKIDRDLSTPPGSGDLR